MIQMMKHSFKDSYTSEQQQVIIVSLITMGICFLGLSPFFFFNHMDFPLGALLGFLIGIGCYVLLIHQINNQLSFKHPRFIAVLHYFLRMLLFAIGLVLSLLLGYFGYNIFNVFFVFGGYLIPKIIMVIIELKKSKEVDVTSEKSSEDK